MMIARGAPLSLFLAPPVLALALVLGFTGSAHANNETMQQEVEYLLTFVAGSGCTFVRNGTEHNSQDAADHLRLKFKRGAKYANNADQFIDRLASESSWTGRDYTVDCDGVTRTSSEWLHEALQNYRDNTPH